MTKDTARRVKNARGRPKPATWAKCPGSHKAGLPGTHLPKQAGVTNVRCPVCLKEFRNSLRQVSPGTVPNHSATGSPRRDRNFGEPVTDFETAAVDPADLD